MFDLRQPGVARTSLLTFSVIGLFCCFALRELRVGNWAVFLQLAPTLMIFPWGVFAVAFWRLSRASKTPIADLRDKAVVLLAAVACIPLAAEVSLAGLGPCIGAVGALMAFRSHGDAQVRAAGICLLALFANFSVSPLIFRLGYAQFIGLDMALLQGAIDLAGVPVRVTPAGLEAADGLRVMLVGACSSFAGVSAAILVHMGWAMAVRTEVGPRDVIAVIATVGVATMLNIIRLTLTASGHAGYAFWHGGVGETPLGGQIFWFLQNAILLTGGYLSAHWAGRGARQQAQA